MRKRNLQLSGLRLSLLLGVVFPASAFAQQTPPDQPDRITPPAETVAQDPDRVVVTGSFLGGSAEDAPSPVTVIDRASIEAEGAATVWDVVKNLEINQGSTSNSDTGAENGTIEGTANINLRNLGQNSTLTLINGKRQVVAAALTQDGSEFVDINAIPSVMVERLEVLQDGGSALYGSDAVAGVVNMIMRTNFVGFEVNFDYQWMEVEEKPTDMTISSVWGGEFNGGQTHLVLGAEFFQRDPVRLVDTPVYDPATTEFYLDVTDIAATLAPVSGPWYNQQVSEFRQQNDPEFGAATRVYTDPLCTQLGFTTARFGSDVRRPNHTCGADITEYQLVNPGQERFSAAAALNHDFSDSLKFYSFFQYSQNEIQREDLGNSNSLGPAVMLPEGNAVFGLGSRAGGGLFLAPTPSIPNAPVRAANGGIGTLAFVGYNTHIPFPGGNESINETHTQGAQLGLKGDFSLFDRKFDWDVSYAYSKTDLSRTERTIDRYKAELAINGLGGPNCVPNGTTTYNLNGDIAYGNPALNFPLFREYQPGYPQNLRETISLALTSTNQGQGGCHFLNPFLTSLTNPALANDPEMIEWLNPIKPISDRENELQVFDAVLTGELFDLPGGLAKFAVGAQRRLDNKLSRTYDLVDPGIQTIVTYDSLGVPNTFRYASLDNQFGGFVTPKFSDERTVDAAFVELGLPIIDGLETQIAVRYEDYGGNIGAETSPKFAARWQPFDDLAMRFSYSKSFRAPNTGIVFNGTGADGSVVLDRLARQEVRAGMLPATIDNGQIVGTFFRNQPSPNVQSEKADTYNLGFIYQPVGGPLEGFYASIDYWMFDFTDRVVPQPLIQALEPELALFNAAVGNPANYVEAASTNIDAPVPYVPCDPNSLRVGLARRDCVVDPRLWDDPNIDRLLSSAASLINIDFPSVNAGRIITDGIDITARYMWDNDWGQFAIDGAFTYVNRYKIKDLVGFEAGFFGTGVTDAAGTTGDGNLVRSLPDKKGHVSLSWRNEGHSVTGIARYISGYENLAYEASILNRPPEYQALVAKEYDDYLSFDLQYNYTFDWGNAADGKTIFTAGILDVFEAEVPYRVENGQRYDTTVYDPRGRRFYVRFSQRY